MPSGATAAGFGREDALLLAEHDGELIGIVRLTTEEGVVVLRGMQVHPRFQRQGTGKDSLRLSPKSWMAKAPSASRMRISSVSMAESDST